MRSPGGSVAGAAYNPEEKGAVEYEFRLGDELRGERATLGKTLLDVQRDLRIKAAYVAAIEDMDLSVFPNQSFIPGYVRSYARYLHLDPDTVYRRFCAESGFSNPKNHPVPMRPAKGGPTATFPGGPGSAATGSFQSPFPLARSAAGGLMRLPVSAIGSSLVMALMIGGLGYGAWAVLQNIQRVQFAPVDDLPQAYAGVAPLDEPEAVASSADTVPDDLATPVTATALAELYRRQEAEVPILVPRDGPIAALDPDRSVPTLIRAAASPQVPQPGDRVVASDSLAEAILAKVEASVSGTTSATGPTLVKAAATIGDGAPGTEGAPVLGPVASQATGALSVVAERAAWIRVYLPSGTILFEQILEKGQSYTPPEGVGETLIWAGNAGSVYVRIGQELHGPLGSGTRAVRDVVLNQQAILEHFPEVDVVPEVISQAMAPATPEIR